MAKEWELLHSKYTERVSKHREPSRHFPTTLTKSKSTSLSATSTHSSSSSLSHGRDLESGYNRDRSESDSTASLSHSGGLTPQPQPPSRPHSRPTPPPNYINIDFVSGKPAVNETNASEYETPAVSVKKEEVMEEVVEEEEEDKERNGEELRPPYANWQFLSLQPNNISKPVAGASGLQKKPMPLQRKSPGSTDLTLAPSTVPTKPVTPPKPKDLQLPSKPSPTPFVSAPRATSPRPVSEKIPMKMPANPAHSFGGSRKRSETSHDGIDRSTDNAKAKGATKEDNLLQPLAETKLRSYTTSNVDRKQPLLPPAKGRYGSTWVSSKSPQQIPEEQDSDSSISPVQEKDEQTSALEASQESKNKDPSPLELLTKISKPSATTVTTTSTTVTATSTTVAATSTAATVTSSPSRDRLAGKGGSTGGENELMRKLSIRRQQLEQQLQGSSDKAISAAPQSTTVIAERTSEECSHDSTSSTQSELVLAYRRTDDSPLNSTVNDDGSVALRKPDSEKDGNLVKYGIIEDVNGGSFVI